MVMLNVKHCSFSTPALLSMCEGQVFRGVWLWPNSAPAEVM